MQILLANAKILFEALERKALTDTGTKMFLYLTGKPDTVCFKYKGQLYVTDDWRE